MIYVRFVEKSDETGEATVTTTTCAGPPPPKKIRARKINHAPQPGASQPSKCMTSSPQVSQFVPRSLSIVEMLKLGKAINHTSTTISIYTFDLKGIAWSSQPKNVDFTIDVEPFETGGFRKAYKAISVEKEFEGCTWVIKRYLPKTIEDISTIGQTVEDHTRKVVQMHYLARNFAARLKGELIVSDSITLFGETLSYNKIFFGKISTGTPDEPECVTIEEFIDGSFEKYINNNGNICGNSSPTTDKAECLAHFSHERSNEEVMVVDVQGCGHCLFDPEIASRN